MSRKSLLAKFKSTWLSSALTAVVPVRVLVLLVLLLSIHVTAKADGKSCSNVFQTETLFDEQTLSRLMSKYSQNNCHLNSFEVAQELIAAGESARNLRFLLLSSHSGMEALSPRQARLRNDGWKFHVVLLVRDQVYDLDYRKSPGPVQIRSYFDSMFNLGYEVERDINVQVYSYEQAIRERKMFGSIFPLFMLVDSKVKSVRLYELLNQMRERKFDEAFDSLAAIPVYGYGLGKSLWSAIRMPFKLAMTPKGSRVRFDFTVQFEAKVLPLKTETADGILLASNINFIRIRLRSGQIFEVPLELVHLDTFRRVPIDEGLASRR